MNCHQESSYIYPLSKNDQITCSHVRLPPIYFSVLLYYLLFLVPVREIPFSNEEHIFKAMWHCCLPWFLAPWAGAFSSAPCKAVPASGVRERQQKHQLEVPLQEENGEKCPLILAAFKVHGLFCKFFSMPGCLARKQQGFWGDGLEGSIGEQECFTWAGTAGASPPFANVPVVMLSIGGTYE